MVKRVLENSMVAHVWAQQSQDEARSNNGNLHFHGAQLSSYSTVIACIYTLTSGRKVALLTSDSYSSSTNKQLSYARRAVSHMLSFRVPHVVPNPGGMGRSIERDKLHVANLALLVAQYEFSKNSATRAKAGSFTRDESYDERGLTRAYCSMRDALKSAAIYAESFELESPTQSLEADYAAVERAWAERDAKTNSPAAIAKREKVQAEKLARQKRQEESARAEAQTELQEWLAGTGHYCPPIVRLDSNGGALLRVRGEKLETSLGASVPLSHAVRVFRFAAAIRVAGDTWNRDRSGHSVPVGSFQVDRIESDGSFVAGCHRINWAEIDRVARVVGLVPPEVPQGNAGTRD